MANSTVRRPLPALISLVALLLLTGIVWWRVASRDDSADSAASSCPSASASSQAEQLPRPATITVQVLNSTTKAGLAGKVRLRMQELGFGVTAAGNAKPLVPGTASIRFGPTGRKAATLVRYYFPGAAMTATTSKTAIVQVVVGKTYRTVATQAQVDAAVRGDKLTVATSTPPPVPGASC